MAKSFDKDPINEGLLLDLKFKEGSGLITQDWALPHHINPTLTGGPPSWVELDSDLNVLEFVPGSTDRVTITNANSVDVAFTTEDFSIGCWIFIDAYGLRSILSRGKYDADGWGTFIDGNGKLIFSPGTVLTDDVLSTGNWYFVSFVRVGTIVKIYVNGVEWSVTGTTSASISGTAWALNNGTAWTGTQNPWDGKMWRPRIWERALDKSEIKRIFEAECGYFGV